MCCKKRKNNTTRKTATATEERKTKSTKIANQNGAPTTRLRELSIGRYRFSCSKGKYNGVFFFICFKSKLFIYKNLCKLLQVLPIGETDQLVSGLHPSRRDIFAHLCVVVSLSHIQSDSHPANLPVSHSVIH